ncbi:MAG: DUF262 domain-containing protein [Cetobacterium sp.]
MNETYFEEDEDLQFRYDKKHLKKSNIITVPSDYIVKTIFELLESDIIKIPNFQRNYIWEQKRASALIESIIYGLPIPQLFFQVKPDNKLFVIDGHQRLMSIYYFIKGRFPKDEKRAELRKIFDQKGSISEEFLNDNKYFRTFKLKLDDNEELNGLTYEKLEKFKSNFDLKSIRGIGIIETNPKETMIFEIFNRLNTGGVRVKNQELRISIYNSDFFRRIIKLNIQEEWRDILNKSELDLHMSDSEIILRGFAIGENYEFFLKKSNELKETYNNSMMNFLNIYSKSKMDEKKMNVNNKEKIFKKFVEVINHEILSYGESKKFSKTIYETVFSKFYNQFKDKKSGITKMKICINQEELNKFKENEDIEKTITSSTTSFENISKRIEIISKLDIFSILEN